MTSAAPGPSLCSLAQVFYRRRHDLPHLGASPSIEIHHCFSLAYLLVSASVSDSADGPRDVLEAIEIWILHLPLFLGMLGRSRNDVRNSELNEALIPIQSRLFTDLEHLGETFLTLNPRNLADMFIKSTYLTLRRPSPATMLFTVSSAPPRKTVTAHFLFYLTILLRIFIGLGNFVVLATKTQCWFVDHGRTTYTCRNGWPSLPRYVEVFVVQSSWQVLLLVSVMVLFLCFHRFHKGTYLPLWASLGYSLGGHART